MVQRNSLNLFWSAKSNEGVVLMRRAKRLRVVNIKTIVQALPAGANPKSRTIQNASRFF